MCFLCIIRRFPDLAYSVKLNGSTRLSVDFDPLARLTSRTIATTTPFTTTYTYLDGAGSHSTTTLLASLTNGSSPAYSYTYDANGNIRTIKEGSTTQAEYFYDTMNQLIREDSAYSSKSIDYIYEVGGNLTSKTIYTFTGGVRGAQEDSIVYLYENAWKDKLTSYDGQSITYDAIGNPLSYRNGLSFTWANGRELAGVTNNGVTGTFTYNDSGIRTSRTYNGITTSYLLNGSSIVRQTQGESTLDFFYDENGNLYGFQKGTSTYYYLRNGQNDIVGILDSSGIQVVSYTYDAWGNQQPISGSLATTIGVENPFRYRGYYFDTETGLYYLNSRYYDSVTGRFINADGLISASSTLLGTNMYAYCESDPINKVDNNGLWSVSVGVSANFSIGIFGLQVELFGAMDENFNLGAFYSFGFFHVPDFGASVNLVDFAFSPDISDISQYEGSSFDVGLYYAGLEKWEFGMNTSSDMNGNYNTSYGFSYGKGYYNNKIGYYIYTPSTTAIYKHYWEKEPIITKGIGLSSTFMID